MINQIYCSDSLKFLQSMPGESVQHCITSPPYNFSMNYSNYNDGIPYHDYLQSLDYIFEEVYRILKPSGRCIINIADCNTKGTPNHADVMQLMQEIGFKYYIVIVWNKFQVARRTAWGSFKSPSCPSFPCPYEYILVFYKDQKKLLWHGDTDLTKQEFISWSLPLWEIRPESNMKKLGHPAMFPLELPSRCIKMFTYIGDTIIDPFNGLGTTCVAAKLLGRNYIGIDIDQDYCDKAIRRLGNTTPHPYMAQAPQEG